MIEEKQPSEPIRVLPPQNGSSDQKTRVFASPKINGNVDGLTSDQVEEIRSLARGGLGKGRLSHQQIAAHFGVDVGHVKYIANRENK